ncbi:nuclear transport factor 2 family protein [Natrialbaceae archaeon A-CW2]
MDRDNQVRDLLERERIRHLKHRYCYCIDEKRVGQFVNLFTDDALVDFATREPYEGRAEIRQFIKTHIEESNRMAHMACNPVIKVHGEHATGQWYYLVMIAQSSSIELGQGVYHETYRLDNDSWKIESLRTERRFTHNL